MDLMNWSPITTLSLLDRYCDITDFDDMTSVLSRDYRFTPAMDSYTKDNELHLRAEIPGIDPKDIHLTFGDGRLCISGERRLPEAEKDTCVCFNEMDYGSFERCFWVPEGLNSDSIKARCENGILDVTVPLPESAKPREIAIETGK